MATILPDWAAEITGIRRYFTAGGYWTFKDGSAHLYSHNATRITRFLKVIGPLDPTQRVYWDPTLTLPRTF